ncbi:hypothetical protein [Glycomyces sp. NPDC048151]|uniref:hypothetical protein n=1 Tax=Glycomyces sp. NPDC048151 TaxID=3364002 RepID=UPI003723D779
MSDGGYSGGDSSFAGASASASGEAYSSSSYDSGGSYVQSTWYWSQSGRDRQQEQAIASLQARQRSEARRAAERARESQQRLEGRIAETSSRLEARIGVVLAWTELRFQLIEFDEYQARKEIRNTVRALAEGREPLLHGFEDVPGYWLPSAAAGVLPLVLRDRVPVQRTAGASFTDLQTGLEHARERDSVRTELFSLAVGRCFDQPVLIDAAVLRLLSEPADLGVAAPGEVASAWRTLWEQAALGAFGHGAEAQIGTLLRERFDAGSLGEEALAEWDREIERFGATGGRHLPQTEAFAALERHFAPVAGLHASKQKGDRAGLPPLGGQAGDGGARHDAAAGALSTTNGPAEPLGTAGPLADTADPFAAAPTPDAYPYAFPDDTAWRAYLQELIEEPSTAELPLVRQMAELDPTSEGAESDRRSWSDSAGTLADLVRRDLFDPDAPLPLRRLALGLAAPVLHDRLDRLEAAIGTTETAVVTVRRRGELIDVTRDGHDPERFAAVERRVEQAFPVIEPSKPLTVGMVVTLGILGVVMFGLGQWFLGVLFALALAIPIWKHRSDTEKARKDFIRRDEALAEVRAALVKARKDAERQEREETDRGLAARRAVANLRESLHAVAPTGETGSSALAGPA